LLRGTSTNVCVVHDVQGGMPAERSRNGAISARVIEFDGQKRRSVVDGLYEQPFVTPFAARISIAV
jgi:hypothetical protein